jgi:hypothetical protein
MRPYINRSLRSRHLALNLPIPGPERVTISLSRPTHGSPALWLTGSRNEGECPTRAVFRHVVTPSAERMGEAIGRRVAAWRRYPAGALTASWLARAYGLLLANKTE